VWKCPICKQPSLMAIDAECRTFTCPGLRGEKFTVANEIKAWTDRYLKRWDAERGAATRK